MEQYSSQQSSQSSQQDDWLRGATVEAASTIGPENVDVRLDGIEFGTDASVV